MAPCVCSMAECSTTAAGISWGCSERGWWCGCGLRRDSDARRVERQGKTRPEFSAATAGVDRRLKLPTANPMDELRHKNEARGTRDIEHPRKVARVATSERGQRSSFN